MRRNRHPAPLVIPSAAERSRGIQSPRTLPIIPPHPSSRPLVISLKIDRAPTIPTGPHCHSDRREESKISALRQPAQPVPAVPGPPPFSSSMVPVATGMDNCYENRRQTHTVIPAKAGIHRDEGLCIAIFILLRGLQKAIVIPSAAESRNPKSPNARSHPTATVIQASCHSERSGAESRNPGGEGTSRT